LVRRVFEVLGVGESLQTGEGGGVELPTLREPSAELLAVVQDINAHALRVFGDKHAARRRKALANGHRPVKLVGTLGVALAYAGATLSAEYDTARQRKQGTPARYRLRWGWLEEHAPEPRPAHPVIPTR
jgi:hypothetical protein